MRPIDGDPGPRGRAACRDRAGATRRRLESGDVVRRAGGACPCRTGPGAGASPEVRPTEPRPVGSSDSRIQPAPPCPADPGRHRRYPALGAAIEGPPDQAPVRGPWPSFTTSARKSSSANAGPRSRTRRHWPSIRGAHDQFRTLASTSVPVNSSVNPCAAPCLAKSRAFRCRTVNIP